MLMLESILGLSGFICFVLFSSFIVFAIGFIISAVTAASTTVSSMPSVHQEVQ